MNARIATEISAEMANELLASSKEMAFRMGIQVNEAIDRKVKAYVKYSKNNNEAIAWEIRGAEAKKLFKY